jgi:HK97 family phage major capsid protein
MSVEIKELLDAVQKSDQEIKSLIEKQEAEIKKYGASTESTAAAIQKAEKSYEQIQQDIKGLSERFEEVEKKANRPGVGDLPEEMKSPGQRFTESEEFKSAVKRGARNIDSIEVGRFLPLGRKAIGSASTSAGSILDQYRVPEIFFDPAQRPSHIRDVMNVASTTESAVEFMRELVYTNNAGPQWDSDASVADFANKPESNITFELVTAPARTLAHWVAASRQVLSDVAQLRNHIDRRLMFGLMIEEDRQILYGTGSGGDIEGIMVTTGVQSVGSPAGSDTNLDHIRRAVAKARTAEYPVDGILVHPEDWADLELTKGQNGQYVWVNAPLTGGGPTMWRVPVIETTAINKGEFLLGNWSLAATLWDRQQASVRISESHEEFFVKNAIVILVEERVALTVYRPKAFVKGDLDPAST